MHIQEALDVDGGGVASLGVEVVLEVEVVPLAEQLQEWDANIGLLL